MYTMNKGKLFYDILTLILLVLIGHTIYTVAINNGESSYEDVLQSQKNITKTFIIFYVYSLLYAIAIIILAVRKNNKISSTITMVIGSIILPGVLPLIYYVFFLRKKFNPRFQG
jgi:hypothetical protein